MSWLVEKAAHCVRYRRLNRVSPFLLHIIRVITFFRSMVISGFYCRRISEAEEVALVVLRQVMEEKLTSSNIEMASIAAATQK